jgi:hypothetical protein
VNELQNDPRIAPHYQIWLFIYNTGNPILYSGSLLRQALGETVAELDPEGRDPALRRLVVMGHSQGGLLTKLVVVSSGDRFWRIVTDEPFEELEMEPSKREILQKALFFEPLPFVTRVIFVATPHGGSYLAGWSLGHLVSRLVKLPVNLAELGLDLAARNPKSAALRALQRTPTSIDNMTPGNPGLRALAETPIAPGVTAHSIIAVKGDGPPEGGGDGVVRYSSAHIDGVESEKIVRSGHSTQAEPDTITEVRRILLAHLEGGRP